MLDDFEIEAACTVALCVKTAEWEWDAASERGKSVRAQRPNNSIASKIEQYFNWKNCMVAGRAMGQGQASTPFLIKLAHDGATGMYIFCGVVRDGAPCIVYHFGQDRTVGWFMHTDSAATASTITSRLEGPRQVLTMQVDIYAEALLSSGGRQASRP